MKNLLKWGVYSLLLTFLFTSCQDQDEEVDNETLTLSGQPTIVGDQLTNPYTVENMTVAYNALHPNSRTQSLKATDLYVRFFPKDQAEIEVLTTDSTLSLYTYPLDYEIVEEGERYQDPDLPKGALMSFYTVVKPKYQFPNVDYEVLEKLYIPEDDDEDALEDKAFQQAGYEISDEADEQKPGSTNGRLRHRKYRPSGTVLVQDDVLGRNVPLRGARIKIRDWFKIANVSTNDLGQWSSDKEYRSKVDVKVIFENGRVNIRSTFFETFWSARTKIHNEDRPQGAVVVIDRGDSKRWVWATVFNGVAEYYDYCARFGIRNPTGDLNLYIHRKNGDVAFQGSAPMFSKGFKYYRLDWDNGWRWLANRFYIPVTNTAMNLLLKNHMPDVIYQYNQNAVPDAARILGTFYHELGHTSHYAQVGNGYWGRYIKYIISHGSYGNGTENDAPLVGLSESWGNHTGWSFSQDKYGARARVGVAASEAYRPLMVGNGDGIRRNITTGRLEGWMPAGIMQDLIDNNADLVRVGFTDNATGYTTGNLFNALDSDVDSPQDFRNRLLQENGNLDQVDVENLFEAYFYN